jgi:hypothetical protein
VGELNFAEKSGTGHSRVSVAGRRLFRQAVGGEAFYFFAQRVYYERESNYEILH